MLNEEEEEEDDVSFYVQKKEPTILKSVSGSNIYGNLAEERIKINRELSTGTFNLNESLSSTCFFR